MKQNDSKAARVKRQVEVEAFIRWTFRDEMPKRQISAAEGIWNKIEDNRHHGGIDPGHGAAQRYAHHGLPHPDAEAMFKAVEQLQPGCENITSIHVSRIRDSRFETNWRVTVLAPDDQPNGRRSISTRNSVRSRSATLRRCVPSRNTTKRSAW